MANLIDWYVIELKLLLQGKLPSNRVEEITKEAEAHLRESVQRKLGPAVDEDVATSVAVEAYGRPEKVALGFLRRSHLTMWGLNPAWWAGIGTLITIFCWNFHWATLAGYFDNFGDTWQNELAGVVGILGLVLVVSAVRARLQSCRIAVTLTTVAAVVLSIPLMSYWMIPANGAFQGISRFHLNRDFRGAERGLSHIEATEALMVQGMREYALAKSPSDLSPILRDPSLAARQTGSDRLIPAMTMPAYDHGGKFVVPRQYGAFVDIAGSTIALETAEKFEDAKKQWADTAANDLKQVQAERRSFAALVKNVSAAKTGKLFFFEPDVYLETVFGTLFLLPLFLIVDWIAARTAFPKRRWPKRALA